MKQNPIARALRSPHLRPRIVRDKKAAIKHGYTKHKKAYA